MLNASLQSFIIVFNYFFEVWFFLFFSFFHRVYLYLNSYFSIEVYTDLFSRVYGSKLNVISICIKPRLKLHLKLNWWKILPTMGLEWCKVLFFKKCVARTYFQWKYSKLKRYIATINTNIVLKQLFKRTFSYIREA